MAKAKQAKRKKVKWVGNKAKWEFHRIVEGETHPPECNFDKINPKNLVYEKTAKIFRGSGYDAAAHCTVRFKSRDNE